MLGILCLCIAMPVGWPNISNRQHVHRYLFHVDAWNVPIYQEIKCRESLMLPSVWDGSDRFILLFYYVYYNTFCSLNQFYCYFFRIHFISVSFSDSTWAIVACAMNGIVKSKNTNRSSCISNRAGRFVAHRRDSSKAYTKLHSL